jgi:hypothetical protein
VLLFAVGSTFDGRLVSVGDAMSR